MTERHFKIYVLALIVIAVGFSLLPGANAASYVDKWNVTQADNGVINFKAGYNVTINVTRNINNVSILNGCAATVAYVYNSSGVLVANGTFSGKTANFMDTPTLYQNAKYFLVWDNGGSDYTFYYQDPPMTASIYATTTTLISGTRWDGSKWVTYNPSCMNYTTFSDLPAPPAAAPSIALMNFTSDGGQNCTSWLNSSNWCNQQRPTTDATPTFDVTFDGAVTRVSMIGYGTLVTSSNTTTNVTESNNVNFNDNSNSQKVSAMRITSTQDNTFLKNFSVEATFGGKCFVLDNAGNTIQEGNRGSTNCTFSPVVPLTKGNNYWLMINYTGDFSTNIWNQSATQVSGTYVNWTGVAYSSVSAKFSNANIDTNSPFWYLSIRSVGIGVANQTSSTGINNVTCSNTAGNEWRCTDNLLKSIGIYQYNFSWSGFNPWTTVKIGINQLNVTQVGIGYTGAYPNVYSNLSLTSLVVNTSVTANLSGISYLANSTDWRKNGASIAILHLTFNENTNATNGILDHSTNGHNYTASATRPTWKPSTYGGSFTYNTTWGVTITNQQMPVVNRTWAVSAWYNFSGTNGTTATLFGDANANYGFLRWNPTTTVMSFEPSNKDGVTCASGIVPITQGAMTHIVVVANQTRFEIYKNGLWISNLTSCSETDLNITRIGSGYNGALFPNWNGTIDDFMVFNTTINADQAHDLYESYTQANGMMGVGSSFLSAGDQWKVCAQSTNSIDSGLTLCSEQVMIRSTATSSPTIITPVAGTYRQNITISYNESTPATGASIIGYTIDLYQNTTYITTLATTTNLSMSYNTTLTNDGHNYTVIVTATDTYGITNTSTSEQFTIDNNVPNMTAYTVLPTSPATYDSTRSTNFSINVTDTASSVYNVTLDVDGTLYAMNLTTGITYVAGVMDLSTGTHLVNITSCDAAGNCVTRPYSSYVITNFDFRPCGNNATTQYNLSVLNVTILNSVSFARINSTSVFVFSALFGGANATYNFNFTNAAQWALCSNTVSSIPVTGTITYQDYAGNYSSNSYAFNNANFTGGTPIVLTLYLTPSTSVTIITVQDFNHNPVVGATVSAQTILTGSSTYQTVSSQITGSDGKLVMNLIPYTQYYKFIVYDIGGTLRLTTAPTVITASQLTLQLPDVDQTQNEYETVRSSTCSVTYNNATNSKNASYSFSTSTGEPVTACLNVYDQSSMNQYLFSQNCVTSSTGTLFSHVNDTTRTYGIIGTVTFSDTNFTMPCGVPILLEKNVVVFNNAGLILIFLDLIVFTVLVGMGLWNPIVMIVMGTLALFTMYMTAFLSIGQASIIGLAVISGLLIYRIKQGWG